MPPYDIIKGSKLYGLMNKLVSDQTLIKLSVPRTAYGRLTVITQVHPEQTPLYFRIDPPQGVRPVIERRQTKALAFEFTDQDRIAHRFEAMLRSNSANDIWLHVPEQIERVQQRENVRIEPEEDSFLLLYIDGYHINLPIENMSIGGALCTCPKKYKPLIELKQQWENVPMELVLGMDVYHLTIGKMQVLRIMPGTRPRHFNIALSFRQINRQAQQKLVQFINTFQRVILKNRND